MISIRAANFHPLDLHWHLKKWIFAIILICASIRSRELHYNGAIINIPCAECMDTISAENMPDCSACDPLLGAGAPDCLQNVKIRHGDGGTKVI
jgi:hypothetical protein